MRTLTLPLKGSDIDTRPKRRRVCARIANEVAKLHEAEVAYMKSVAGSADGVRYLRAKRAADELLHAMCSLYEASDPL